MPLIGIDTYKILFSIVETNNPKTLVLLDQSNYLSVAEKPLLFVTLPGYTGHIELSYAPSTIITLNSDVLQLTENTDYEELADLPDGVYQIKMAVCPYDELYNKQCYLKTTNLDCRLQNILLTYDNCECIDQKDLKDKMLDIFILIQSAKAEVNLCNVSKAVSKYKTAVLKIEYLEKKLNCK